MVRAQAGVIEGSLRSASGHANFRAIVDHRPPAR